MKFTDNVDPMTTPSAVWEIVKNGVANNPYNIINLDYRGYFMQRESGENAHMWRCSDNGGGTNSWGAIALTYAEGGWQLNTNITGDNNHIGPWNFGTKGNSLNDEFASNRASGSTYYDIYAIPRLEYYKNQSGSFNNNQDVSGLIVNNECVNANVQWLGSPTYAAYGFEFFNKTFDSYQVIKNLPAGYYRLTVQGYDRNTDDVATYGKEDAIKQAYLYAGSVSVLMKGIYDDASDTQLNGGTDEVESNGKYMPKMPATAQKYFEAGKYINELYVYHTGGDLRVGVKKDANGGNDWVYVDNFTLTHVASSPTVQMDFTSSIVNPSFEDDFTGWENTSMKTQNNNSFVGKQGTYYAEIFNINQTFGISQQVQNLPAGFYVVSANAYQHGSYYQDWPTLRAGDKKVNVLSNSDTYYVAAQLQNAGNLSVGFGGRASGNSNWATVDDFHVVYYPTLPDVTAETGAMNADVLATLTSAKTTYDGAKTVDNFNAFQNANMAAKVSEKIYTDISAAIDAQVTADQDKLNKVSQGVKDAYNSYIQTIRDKRTYNTVEEAQAELTDAFAHVIRTQTGGVDMTGFITNPSFETNSSTGWSLYTPSSGGDVGVMENSGDTYRADGGHGTYLLNVWNNNNDEKWAEQTITDLPNGTYKIQALLASDADVTINLSGNGLTNEVKTANPKTQFADFSVDAPVSDGTLRIRVSTTSWFKADNFRLTYLSLENSEEVKERVRSTLNNVEVQIATTNVYNKAAWQELNTEYAEGSFTADEITKLNSTNNSNDTRYSSGYARVLLSAWNVNGSAATNNSTLYINNWSSEGNTDGSLMTKPFFESWVSSGNIPQEVLTNEVTDLIPEAKYAVSMLVRVQHGTDELKPITLQAGEGETVDITKGVNVNNATNYKWGTFTAYGTADAEGKLLLTINVPESSNVSWLSFKHVNVLPVDEANYLLNGDFEDRYFEQEETGVASDRAIYKPVGWNIEYVGDENDMTIMNSGDKAANNFNDKLGKLATGGNNTLFYRGRWGTTTDLIYSQEITLPVGTYILSCDAWKGGLGGNGEIFIDETLKALDGNQDAWRKLSMEYTLSETKTVKVGFKITHTAANEDAKFIGFDNFKLQNVATMKIAEGKYSTFCAPFDVELPEGILAYQADKKDDGSSVKLTDISIEGRLLPAGTAVIIRQENGVEIDKAFYGKSSISDTKCTTGNLVGNLTDRSIPAGSYVLQTKEGVQKFYKVQNNSKGNLNRCYLQMESSASEVRIADLDDDPTSIDQVQRDNGQNATYYTIDGIQLTTPQKGICIVRQADGTAKKVYVK